MQESIESFFRRNVQKDPKINNAYLLVDSTKLGVHLNVAEGSTDGFPAHPQQPNYMASVGKIFTSTLVSILFEKQKLSFEEPITEHLDPDLLKNLHVYKGKDYTDKIKVKHLLNQTSGLYDVFWQLLNRLYQDPDFEMAPREAVIWGKENCKPYSPPGKKFHYTDTNYYLLGLIIEKTAEMPFHSALKEWIFKPLKMRHSYMMYYSKPLDEPKYPMANFFDKGKKLTNFKGYAGIDYAGGGVVAPLDDLLMFMKSLVNHEIIQRDTLKTMMEDRAKFGLGIDYGYGIWQLKTIPLLMPKKFNSWGVAGSTGAFMFYHPNTDAYLIGNFNDTHFTRKAIRFMIKIINKLDKMRP